MLVIDFFFFKQKTAYEMRISDWSSDVCSSDLPRAPEKKCGEWCDQACKDEGGTQTPAGILIELPRDRVAGRPDEQRSQTHADQVQDQKEEGGDRKSVV